ncbi:MAG: Crp/Fnr family transcriptional regulator [Cyclobacteriaceae bacterium]|nr:Crp/Fnr family transcriptional regulator [Cyclobacteriaceae bacterium]MCB0500559.1 Crp/Fnr family transcriptional regulator [Cyclobacteriaceae bacterium]MCB9239234.1 Crp/Fnr family transcriptional regulator [Flammeovirgaceae bacterium]MCO5272440.1 Crp/Fnr family transcriptional regulator [Cyclobacteriaceae bacterium]MCW5903333.1 Crp/Fnr family transcriptional regulator [Cyclobacteriaceae bacterium]
MDAIHELKTRIASRGLWAKDILLKRNGFLIRAGAIERHLYFVDEGTLRAFVGKGGEEYVVRFAYPGSIITALDSFLSGKPTQFSLQAIKQCRLKAVEKEMFNALISSDGEFSRLYQLVLQALVLQQMEREMDILTSSPAERYKRVLDRSPHLFQHVPARHIASYLGMKPETLSRIKKP